MLNENALQQFTGTEHYYRHFLKGFYYTDGCQYLADEAGAHWLLDAIASYQPQLAKHRDHRLREMQFWNLKVTNKTAVLTCRADSDVPPAITQEIEFTDFPLAEIDIWVSQADGAMVAMLKSEY